MFTDYYYYYFFGGGEGGGEGGGGGRGAGGMGQEVLYKEVRLYAPDDIGIWTCTCIAVKLKDSSNSK